MERNELRPAASETRTAAVAEKPVGQAMAATVLMIGVVALAFVAGLLLLGPISTVAIIAPLFGESNSLLQGAGAVIVLAAVSYQNKLPQALMRTIRGEDKIPVSVEQPLPAH